MTLLTHAAYIAWSGKAVRLANERWRARTPYIGETLMSRASLNSHLFRWGIEAGLIANPGLRRSKSESIYVAAVFETHPELIKNAARAYWKTLVEQHA